MFHGAPRIGLGVFRWTGEGRDSRIGRWQKDKDARVREGRAVMISRIRGLKKMLRNLPGILRGRPSVNVRTYAVIFT